MEKEQALAPAKPASKLPVPKPEPGKEEAQLPTIYRDPYEGISMKPFKAQSAETLMASIDAGDIEIRPDGIVYLPEIKYRRRLNHAFGPGGWALMPRDKITMIDQTMTREYALYVDGRFVSEARGEQDFIPNNPNFTYATATEGVKSNALMRCCKDVGIASELWDPVWIDAWKKGNAIQVWRDSQKKPQWRRKDRDKFYDERGPVDEKQAPAPPAKPQAKAETSPPPKPQPKKPGPQRLEVKAPPAPPPEREPHQEEAPAQDEPGQDAGEGENLIPEGDSGLRPVWIKLVDDSRKGDPAKGEDWQLWGLKVQDENETYYVNTFNATHGATAQDIKTKAVWANIVWEWARDRKTGEKKLFKGKPSRNLVYIEEAQG